MNRLPARWLLGVLLLLVAGAVRPAAAVPVAPAVAEALDSAAAVPFAPTVALDSAAYAPFWVWLAPADLSTARAAADPDTRARLVYTTLRDHARATQAPLLAFLAARHAAGAVQDVRPFFIVNAVRVTGDAATLAALRARADVVDITADPGPLPTPVMTAAHAPATLEWGIAQIGADQVWSELGTTGAGAVVAVLGTGADAAHPALVTQYRGTADGSHDFNWYDPTGTFPTQPGDTVGLGTHMTGTAVGGDGGSNEIGVAPGAHWIAVRGCSLFCDSADLLLAAEWLLAPCPVGVAPGDPACDPDRRPDVVVNGWGGGQGNDWFWAAADAWVAAGILPVFGVGAGGPGGGSVASPADYCQVAGVGASDMLDVVASFSGRGPGSFVACPEKPDYLAPGVNIRSAAPGSGYTVYNGTSMAAAHVAGCAALLRALDPALPVAELDALLASTALDLGAPGFDYDYGAGRIDCYAAAQQTVGFVLSADPATVNVCKPAVAATTLTVTPVGDYSQPVTLSSSVGGAFSVNPVIPPGSSVLSGSTAFVPPGSYTVTVTGSDGTRSRAVDVAFNVYGAPPAAPLLSAPANGAGGVARQPTLVWQPAAQAATYAVAVYTNPANPLGSLVDVALGLTDTSHTVTTLLESQTTYYWAVRATNACGRAFSARWSFTTGN